MNKKLSKEISARTTADSSTNADDMHVSPAIAKPNVAGLCHLRYNLPVNLLSTRKLLLKSKTVLSLL